MSPSRGSIEPSRARRRLLLGAALILVAWPLTWQLPGMRSHILFFPLWLGYILAVDALVEIRRGNSILGRSPRGFVMLFLASIPIWWLFELLNRRVGNWEYLGRDDFGDLEYAFWASLCFSTVVPAVFETAELLSTLDAPRLTGGRFHVSPALVTVLIALGLTLTAALLAWPGVTYPLLWIAPILVFDPIALALRRPSILGEIDSGNWRPPVYLALGALTCGFFWELWNYFAFPKWIYHVPGVEFWHLFEMPALGYLGYLPFGVSLYGMTYLVCGGAAPRLWIQPRAAGAPR